MGGGVVHIDDLTVDTPNASGWTTEAREDFNQTADYGREQPTHDAAGNLTYDGLYAYEYDAWNHLVKVSRAYRDPDTGSLAVGSIVMLAEYDGLGRRIVKRIQNSADLNCTYHYYYDGQSVVEQRDGSDLTIKQHVWGNLAGGYIDELVQTAINEDPLNDSTCETVYYAATGSNYNVLGLFDETGTIAERYEYTPYGERQVYTSSGTNDPAAYAPLMMSQRVEDASGNRKPYGINAIGHQGLIHDEATGLIYNRARMLSPRLGRFLQRDPMGYVDGGSLYAAYGVMRGGVDPFGLAGQSPVRIEQTFGSNGDKAFIEVTPPGSPNDFSEISILDKNNNEVDRYKRTKDGWKRIEDHGGSKINRYPEGSKMQKDIDSFVEDAQKEIDSFRGDTSPSIGKLKKALAVAGVAAFVLSAVNDVYGVCTANDRCDDQIREAIRRARRFKNHQDSELELKLSLTDMIRCILNGSDAAPPAIALVMGHDFVADRRKSEDRDKQ